MKNLEELLFLQSLPGLGKAAVYRDYMDLLPQVEGIDGLAGMLGMDVSSAEHVKESVKKRLNHKSYGMVRYGYTPSCSHQTA